MRTCRVALWCMIALAPGAEVKAQGPDPLHVARANFSKIVDCQFVFEGEIRRIHPAAGPGPFPGDEDYQGTYTFRSLDGATHLELYHQGLLPNLPMKHTVDVLLKGSLMRLDHTPDLSRRETPMGKSGGGPGALSMMTNPERFVFFYLLRAVLEDRREWSDQALGTAVVDGHECRIVEINELPGFDAPDKPLIRYFLDLQRGGLPLKVEYARKGVVKLRTHSVRVESFQTPDGQQVYFPVAGVTEIFDRDRGEVPGESRLREECTIVPSSLRLNQNLGDDVFAVRREALNITSPALSATRSRFGEAEKHPTTTLRTDPTSVREKLEKNLAEADRQERQIEASSVARDASLWDQAGWIVPATALLILGVVVLIRRRGR